MKKNIKQMLLIVLKIAASYLVISLILGYLIFPQIKPRYTGYFKPGDELNSKGEGFNQTVVSVSDGWVNTRLVIDPHGDGPPEHLHEGFEEKFTVKQGTLSVLLNGKKVIAKAGESILIPKNTPHKPFNETNETVIVENTANGKSFPEQFGYYLSQFYVFADAHGKNLSVPKILLQMSVYGNEWDSWLVQGPPVAIQKALRFILQPTARFLGYRNNQEK
jgi:mannose-6-phosphate isomerase-like protein (cupin superfamily)